jgi:hypothetical protein
LIAETKLKRKKIHAKDLMDSFTACTKASKLEIFFCWLMMKNIDNCTHKTEREEEDSYKGI